MMIWLRRLAYWVGLSRGDEHLAEELAFHQEMKEQSLRDQGLSMAQARIVARRTMGSSALAHDHARGVWMPEWLSAVQRDVRFSGRLLKGSPGFVLAVTATLAVTMGVNTAVFTLVDHLIVRPLSYPDPDRLVTVVRHYQRGAVEGDGTSQNGTTWFALSDAVDALDLALAGGASGVNVVQQNESTYVSQQRVSAGFFEVLGVTPLVGRGFTTDEDRNGGPPAAVLSYGFARRFFGGAREAFGQQLLVKGEPATVVGVMPPRFHSNVPADLWTPLRPSTTGEGSGQNYVIVGRIRAGATRTEAEGQIATAGANIVRDVLRPPPDVVVSLRLLPLKTALTADVRSQLVMLWIAGGLLLLVSCVNIAGLMLARMWARTPELATRIAVGGGRAAIVRQLLIESLLLAACGGVPGVALGYAIARGISGRLQDVIALPMSPDIRIVALSALAVVGTGILFGLVPSLQASRTDVRSFLSAAGTTTMTPTRHWTTRSLVVIEIAVALVLVVSAGLLLRTLGSLTSLRPGFDGRNVLTGRVSLQDARYRDSQSVNALFAQTLEAIRRTPGVEDAAVALTLPYARTMNQGWRRPGEPRSQPQPLNYTYVTPGYFRLLRIGLKQGRVFDDRDTSGSSPVVVVNEAFVRSHSPGAGAVGSYLTFGSSAPLQVIGVVDDVQQVVVSGAGSDGPLAPFPAAYVPAAQVTSAGFALAHTWFEPSWIVRGGGTVETLAAAMRNALRTADPQLPLVAVRSMDDVRSEAVTTNRIQALFLSALASIALLLCAVAVYGVMAGSVAARDREFAIKLALGAGHPRIVHEAIWSAVVLAAAGTGVGLVLALLATSGLRRFVFGVSATDHATFGAAAGIMVVTATAAALIPALRVRRLRLSRVLRTA